MMKKYHGKVFVKYGNKVFRMTKLYNFEFINPLPDEVSREKPTWVYRTYNYLYEIIDIVMTFLNFEYYEGINESVGLTLADMYQKNWYITTNPVKS